MLGISLGLAFALTFAVNTVITRRGVLRASADYVANVSIFFGPCFFLIAAIVSGELFGIGSFPWQAYLYFAISGVVHFVLGRTFAYRSVQLIGATRSGIGSSIHTIVGVSQAVVVLGETVTPVNVLGILLILMAPLLVGFKERTVPMANDGAGLTANRHVSLVDRRTLGKGLLYGFGSGVFWGSSALFIKLGLESGGSPIAGTFIAYLAAALAICPLYVKQKNRRELVTGDRKSLNLALWVGLTTSLGQMFRYMALVHTSVIVITVMTRSIPIWGLLLSFMFNRRLESFSRWVLLANGLVFVGSMLVIL